MTRNLLTTARMFVLGAALLCLHPSALQAGRFLEWDCGGPFIGCSPDPQNPIQLSIDALANPKTYQANGISLEAWDLETPPQPFTDHEFSFAFDTGAGKFVLVIDLTYQQDNGGSTAKNVQSTSIFNVTTYPSPFTDGLITLSIDTLYADGSLPKEYSDYLGTKTAAGYVLLDYDPNADDKGRENVIYGVQVVIVPTPEPVAGVLTGSALILLLLRGRSRRARILT